MANEEDDWFNYSLNDITRPESPPPGNFYDQSIDNIPFNDECASPGPTETAEVTYADPLAVPLNVDYQPNNDPFRAVSPNQAGPSGSYQNMHNMQNADGFNHQMQNSSVEYNSFEMPTVVHTNGNQMDVPFGLEDGSFYSSQQPSTSMGDSSMQMMSQSTNDGYGQSHSQQHSVMQMDYQEPSTSYMPQMDQISADDSLVMQQQPQQQPLPQKPPPKKSNSKNRKPKQHSATSVGAVLTKVNKITQQINTASDSGGQRVEARITLEDSTRFGQLMAESARLKAESETTGVDHSQRCAQLEAEALAIFAPHIGGDNQSGLIAALSGQAGPSQPAPVQQQQAPQKQMPVPPPPPKKAPAKKKPAGQTKMLPPKLLSDPSTPGTSSGNYSTTSPYQQSVVYQSGTAIHQQQQNQNGTMDHQQMPSTSSASNYHQHGGPHSNDMRPASNDMGPPKVVPSMNAKVNVYRQQVAFNGSTQQNIQSPPDRNQHIHQQQSPFDSNSVYEFNGMGGEATLGDFVKHTTSHLKYHDGPTPDLRQHLMSVTPTKQALTGRTGSYRRTSGSQHMSVHHTPLSQPETPQQPSPMMMTTPRTPQSVNAQFQQPLSQQPLSQQPLSQQQHMQMEPQNDLQQDVQIFEHCGDGNNYIYNGVPVGAHLVTCHYDEQANPVYFSGPSNDYEQYQNEEEYMNQMEQREQIGYAQVEIDYEAIAEEKRLIREKRIKEYLLCQLDKMENPDPYTKFKNMRDVVERLLPFHICDTESNPKIDADMEENITRQMINLQPQIRSLEQRIQKVCLEETFKNQNSSEIMLLKYLDAEYERVTLEKEREQAMDDLDSFVQNSEIIHSFRNGTLVEPDPVVPVVFEEHEGRELRDEFEYHDFYEIPRVPSPINYVSPSPSPILFGSEIYESESLQSSPASSRSASPVKKTPNASYGYMMNTTPVRQQHNIPVALKVPKPSGSSPMKASAPFSSIGVAPRRSPMRSPLKVASTSANAQRAALPWKRNMETDGYNSDDSGSVELNEEDDYVGRSSISVKQEIMDSFAEEPMPKITIPRMVLPPVPPVVEPQPFKLKLKLKMSEKPTAVVTERVEEKEDEESTTRKRRSERAAVEVANKKIKTVDQDEDDDDDVIIKKRTPVKVEKSKKKNGMTELGGNKNDDRILKCIVDKVTGKITMRIKRRLLPPRFATPNKPIKYASKKELTPSVKTRLKMTIRKSKGGSCSITIDEKMAKRPSVPLIVVNDRTSKVTAKSVEKPKHLNGPTNHIEKKREEKKGNTPIVSTPKPSSTYCNKFNPFANAPSTSTSANNSIIPTPKLPSAKTILSGSSVGARGHAETIARVTPISRTADSIPTPMNMNHMLSTPKLVSNVTPPKRRISAMLPWMSETEDTPEKRTEKKQVVVKMEIAPTPVKEPEPISRQESPRSSSALSLSALLEDDRPNGSSYAFLRSPVREPLPAVEFSDDEDDLQHTNFSQATDRLVANIESQNNNPSAVPWGPS